MSNKTVKTKKTTKTKTPAKTALGAQPDVPPPPIMPGGPPSGVIVSQGGPSEWKDPKPEKPIRDILNINGAPVDVVILKGKDIEGKDVTLVHVQNGRSGELLTA